MRRSIVGFRKDEEDHWVAVLDCGHPQHTRHRPPFEVREWTETQEGRDSKKGVLLDCLRCEDMEWPEGFAPYKKTKEWTESNIPKGLLANHSTKTGVWGKIHVVEGCLRYIVEGMEGQEFLLTPEAFGVVLPGVVHRVEPVGSVRFFVEFHKVEEEPKTMSAKALGAS